ncbi:MAG: VRR-NUC domain-containing protein [Sulfurimonas sp.]|uniref:VRR-NUC domain-containing protein n=1 Tax=Sulfurimonas sp. TaxID=2022749 RepID=UPI003D0BB722
MSEAKLQTKMIKRLEKENWYVRKVIAANRKGTPDIIACCDGQFVAIEVKLPGNKASALQEENISRIQEAGGKAVVLDSMEGLEGFIQGIKNVYTI